MTGDEIIEQVKEKLRQSLQEITDALEPVREALDLLESAQAEPPEPVRQIDGGDFKEELESCYRSVVRQGAWQGYSVHSIIAPLIRKAIDRLDAQQQEIEKLKADKFCPKCGCQMRLFCEADVKERGNLVRKECQEEIDRLTAENAKLKEELEYQGKIGAQQFESLRQDIEAREEKNKVLTERIEKLSGLLETSSGHLDIDSNALLLRKIEQALQTQKEGE